MNHPAFGLIGVFLILFIAWIFSENKKAIRPRTVIVCFALQIAIAVLVLYVPFGQKLLTGMSDKVTTLLSYADAGIGFIFGDLANTEKVGFVFLVKVLPVVIFFAALMEVLYHLRVMQFVVRYGGKGVRWLTGTRPVESLNVIANVFVGQTEAPLSLKPYLPSISRAELFTIMVSGMASIAGTVLAGYIQLGIRPEYLIAACFMSAPAGLLMAKIIMPDDPKDLEKPVDEVFDLKKMVIDALMRDKQLMVDLFLKCGAEEFKFIERSGFYFGFLFGIPTMLFWHFFPVWWILPVGGLLVGYLTNEIALKLIFSPKRPVKFIGFTFQGMFLKRQNP